MKKPDVYVLLTCCVIILGFTGCISPFSSNSNKIIVGLEGDVDYTSIQEAIDNAPENATIFVQEGIYVENLLINHTIKLEGAYVETTIIDGNGTDDVIHITYNGRATITGFTIRNSGLEDSYPQNDAGIELKTSYNVIDNNIIEENLIGIYSREVMNNTISNNTIHSNKNYGIYMYTNSNGNLLKENLFENNNYGMRIKGSEYNVITQNIFQKNRYGLYFCCGATDNMVYHNSFINNSVWHVSDYIKGNQWDNGEEGNYWSDYDGSDDDGDGIGDTPHNISEVGNKFDLYPLIEPISIR
jgi:parallel beta-helix repeat protein